MTKSTKLAAIIAAGCCLECGTAPVAPTGPTAPPSSNHAPVASVAVSPTAVPIAGATRVTFAATASDPDGEAVTVSWQFGDGQTGSGTTVSHAFAQEGAYVVVLAATDGHGETTKVTTNVVVKGLTGDWVDDGSRIGFTFEQHGSTFDGIKTSAGYGLAAVRGSVQDPRSTAFELTYDITVYPDNHHEQYRCYFQGALDDTGDRFHVDFDYKKSDKRCPKETYNAARHPY